jgi:hypothetical protein
MKIFETSIDDINLSNLDINIKNCSLLNKATATRDFWTCTSSSIMMRCHYASSDDGQT